MRRFFNPFILALSLILVLAYTYLAISLTSSSGGRAALALPFLCIWIVPFRYWGADKGEQTGVDEVIHFAAYLSMGWLNFIFFLTLFRDLWLILANAMEWSRWQELLLDPGTEVVLAASFFALSVGLIAALRGPIIKTIDIPIADLHPALEGYRIVQISDLHASSIIRERYVKRVVEMANSLDGDMIALTGDLVDGSVKHLASTVAPLAELVPRDRAYVIMGNHEYYSGAKPWIDHFRGMGFRVLLNDYVDLNHKGAAIRVGGVVDPAARSFQPPENPRPDLAAGPDASDRPDMFRLLLAHNPKLAAAAAPCGFHLQLSGHTHAGQFFPWTLAVRMVHAPHVAGLSRQDKMWVYVNAGTGTWGPPLRFGTKPELTLIRLVRGSA